MKNSRSKRLLAVIGIAAGLLFLLFITMTSESVSDAGVAWAAAPPTLSPTEEADKGSAPVDAGGEDELSLWAAIEDAYHSGDRERLLALGEQVDTERQPEFARVLAAFDGEIDEDKAAISQSISPSAAAVGINGAACSYASIGAAISAASDGDTIYIPSGNTYYEQLGIISKDLSLVASLVDCSAPDPGATSTSVVIDGSGNFAGIYGGIAEIGLGTTVTFTHISLKDAKAYYGGILYVGQEATAILDNSEVGYGEAGNFGGGVRVYRNATLIVKNHSIIHRNAVTGTTSGGGGLSAYQGAITVTGNSSIGLGNGGNTSADQGGGIYLHSSTLYLDNSFVSTNNATTEGGGIFAFGGSVIEMHGFARIGGYFEVFSNTAQYGGGAYLAGANTGLVLSDTAGVVMNHSTDDGGGVYARAEAYLTLRGGSSEVLSNTTSTDGGGVYLIDDGTRLNMIYGGGRIQGNTASGSVGGGGGGVYVTQGASLYAEASTIGGNDTTVYGGGILVAQDGAEATTSVILNQGTVISDNVAWLGGGLYIADDGAQVIVDGSRVESNRATQTGGGIRVFGDSRLDIRAGSALIDNQAAGYGGGLAMYTGTVSLNLVTMTHNTSGSNGGAILQSRGVLTITDGDLRFNSAGDDGGGIYRSGGSLLLEAATRNSYLAVNEATRGGGLYDTSGSSAEIHAPWGFSFSLNTNSARDVGGGIFLTNTSALDIFGDIIASTNEATQHGGLAYVNGSRLTISKEPSSPTPQLGGANQALNGNGGAIYAENGAFVGLYKSRLGSTRSPNYAAQNGGGIYANDSAILLRDTQIAGNKAGLDGGGLYLENDSELVVDTTYAFPATVACDPAALSANEYCSEIRDNEAQGWGAGLYLAQSNAIIENTAFTDNVGLGSGTSPGTAVLVGSDASVTVRNGLFTGNGVNDNTTVHIYDNGSYTSVHGTYAGNFARPLYVIGTAAITLTNNIMWDNGSPALYQPGAAIVASCNDSQSLLAGPDNISADPKFVTTSRGSYRLGSGSPALDACAGTLDHDLDSLARPIDADGAGSPTEFDMGAFERKSHVFLPIVLRGVP